MTAWASRQEADDGINQPLAHGGCAAVRSGAVIAAIGSTLLRPLAATSPVQ
jgi:hypothetical protein